MLYLLQEYSIDQGIIEVIFSGRKFMHHPIKQKIRGKSTAMKLSHNLYNFHHPEALFKNHAIMIGT